MTEELEQLLKNLKLRSMLKVYDEQLRAAETADISYSDFLAGLLRAQWHDRQESALEWRIVRANLPERLSLETFPLRANPASTASRSALSPNSTLLPSTRIWCSWAQLVSAKLDSPAGSC